MRVFLLINTACQNTENGVGGESNAAFVLTGDEKKYGRGGGCLKHVMDTE